MSVKSRALWLAAALPAIALAGCAIVAETTESRLVQAGFRELPADTPAKISHLQTLPTRKFVKRNRDGKTYYVYADPEYCKCLYVGTVQQYGRYRTLLQQAGEAMEGAIASGEECPDC
jgi:hypothetical protein